MSDAATDINVIEQRLAEAVHFITLTEAARQLPRIHGKKVSICTLWRWCPKSVRRVF